MSLYTTTRDAGLTRVIAGATSAASLQWKSGTAREELGFTTTLVYLAIALVLCWLTRSEQVDYVRHNPAIQGRARTHFSPGWQSPRLQMDNGWYSILRTY